MKIKIKEPWWGAWKKFGWEKNTWGVGLKKAEVEKAIEQDSPIDLHVWKFKKNYTVDPKEVKEYAEKNGTLFKAKYDTQLYVIPNEMLKERG